MIPVTLPRQEECKRIARDVGTFTLLYLYLLTKIGRETIGRFALALSEQYRKGCYNI